MKQDTQVLALALIVSTFACVGNATITSGDKGDEGGAGGGAAGGGAGGQGFSLGDAGPGQPPAGADAGVVNYPGGITRPCAGLECQQTTCKMGDCKQKTCSGAARTTLSGRVYDPAGKVPLYNIIVYVPNGQLDPIPTGPTCDRCDSAVSGKPITATLTDTKGDFVLDNVPVGGNVPLVIQIGKWRRQITLPEVKPCADNHIEDPNLLRLPRSQKEGNIPKIALTTGGADRLECLLRKIGIDPAEFTPEGGPGRINFYAGRGTEDTQATSAYAAPLNGGAAFTSAITFWNDPNSLKKYDMVVLSCEGNWNAADKSQAARQGLVDYANLGGRVFASHWHGVWMQFGPPPWNTVATFAPPTFGGQMSRIAALPDPFLTNIDTSFPKGEALADWLVNVQASPMRGQLSLTEGKHTVFSVDPALARRWIHSTTIPVGGGNTTPTGVQYLTFNTPVGSAAGKECGRSVLTDIHVSAGDMAGPAYPMGCVTQDLSPQEKALEFMLFDLSSCIQPDQDKPKPPVIR